MNSVLLSTAYLPNIDYFTQVLNYDIVLIEACENFQKQSYRNRCTILSANGRLDLSIPLQKNADKELISQKKISYAEKWQTRHWRAITSAYKNSPYFEFFEDEFRPFYHENFELLLDYNTQLLKTILKILRKKKEIQLTENYQTEHHLQDLRDVIHPKHEPVVKTFKPYRQLFNEKFPFEQNLSVIDLLFNHGLNSKDYLEQ
jgi:hypothetical protein